MDTFESSQEMTAPSDFNACLQAHGLYHSKHFVLRLSPINHENISHIGGASIKKSGDVSFEQLKSYSTYIHENIHWWQHKGSISGFMRSMSQIAFCHNNLKDIKNLYGLVGGIKPLLKWWTFEQSQGDYSGTEVERLSNIIINNFMDVQFFLSQSYSPELLREISRNAYFLSQSHSTNMTYMLVINDLVNNVDHDYKIFPDIRGWGEPFNMCREREVPGHENKNIYLPPLGLLDILEGQARMIQLQYLRFSLGSGSFCKAKESGYFYKEYGNAILYFLKMTESEEPDEIEHPLVALFLLVCDICLNPNEGFIDDIKDFEKFHMNVDPGYRFMVICAALRKKLAHLKTAIKDYSKDEYIAVAGEICNLCNYKSPYEVCMDISKWSEKKQDIEKLMSEHTEFSFTPFNIPTKVMLSEFIAYNIDKLAAPEFFCWPGIWLMGEKVSDKIEKYWMNNLALFSDSGSSNTILPRIMTERNNDKVNDTFNNFYGALMSYDFLHQWISADGPFNIDFDWLIDLPDRGELRLQASKLFERQYDIEIEKFTFFKNI